MSSPSDKVLVDRATLVRILGEIEDALKKLEALEQELQKK
jgi:hypothetical protein